MSEPVNASAWLRLHPRDNVLTVVRALPPGVIFESDGIIVQTTQPLGLGHKIAAREIAPGEKVIKYGVAIGSAISLIRAGEHVHTHNLKSDYLPTWSRETQGEWFTAAQRH